MRRGRTPPAGFGVCGSRATARPGRVSGRRRPSGASGPGRRGARRSAAAVADRRASPGRALPAAYPALAADEEAALDLVYAEFLLRREQGEAVAADEFLRRFPQFAGQLDLQFDFGQALASDGAPPAGNDPTNPPASDAQAGAVDDPALTNYGFSNAAAPEPAAGRRAARNSRRPIAVRRPRRCRPTRRTDRRHLQSVRGRVDQGARPADRRLPDRSGRPLPAGLCANSYRWTSPTGGRTAKPRRPTSTGRAFRYWSRVGWPRRRRRRPERGRGGPPGRRRGARGRTASAAPTVTAPSS